MESKKATKENEEESLIFERKALRQIFGPIAENGQHRTRTNEKVYQLF